MLISMLKKQISKRRQQHTDLDVLIIGAGISGIAMASHLKRDKTFNKVYKNPFARGRIALVEKRSDVGGTWDLFRYPGIRSDSDMFTLGFAHRPWRSNKTMTDGASIKGYIKKTAKDEKLLPYIQFDTEVVSLNWSSQEGCWTAVLKDAKSQKSHRIKAKFVVGATGYYDFEQGYRPTFENESAFKGQIIHPQQWNPDIQYDDKRVIVIGSGATAMTLVPALVNQADKQCARHVTLLQRSPTYVANIPSTDNTLKYLTKFLPISDKTAYQVVRWKHIFAQQGLYKLSRVAPNIMRLGVNLKLRKELIGDKKTGKEPIDKKHFSPSYNPWDERFCAVPDGDLFDALHSERADIVTDHIEHFTETGIQLKSGQHLTADIIVTATGLQLQMLGGAKVSIDEAQIDIGSLMTYKAVLVEEVPNMAVLFGYTNASWTLKIDLACEYVVNLLKHMSKNNVNIVKPMPISSDGQHVYTQEDTVLGSLQAGYIQRAKDALPKQGDREPWIVKNDYLYDKKLLLQQPIADNWLQFSKFKNAKKKANASSDK